MSSTSKMKQITDRDLRRSAEVAKLCYTLAKEKYDMQEEDARAMYLLGWNANVGCIFDPDRPRQAGAMIAAHAFPETAGFAEAIQAIGHSKCENAFEWILNEAEMSVDLTGKVMGFSGRLAELAVKYGKDSEQYTTAKKQIGILNDHKQMFRAFCTFNPDDAVAPPDCVHVPDGLETDLFP